MAATREIYLMAVLVVVAAAAMAMAMALDGTTAEYRVDHVVGGDPGWDASSDIKSWSSDRIFRVGDNIWFSYSAAEESISELKTKQEFDSCDVSNPIKMYTDGVSRVGLDGVGSRYFVSSKPQNCRNGLKLNVEVQPSPTINTEAQAQSQVLAQGPIPSASVRLSCGLLLALALVCLAGLF